MAPTDIRTPSLSRLGLLRLNTDTPLRTYEALIAAADALRQGMPRNYVPGYSRKD